MRQVVERLDAAIIAVLVATTFPEPNFQEPARSGKPVWRGMSPRAVENYMIDLTGYSGWSGVVETRDILQGCLTLLCGKKAKAVTSQEGDRFTAAGWEALRQLTDLVNIVAESNRG
jgi:hypothetical protein